MASKPASWKESCICIQCSVPKCITCASSRCFQHVAPAQHLSSSIICKAISFTTLPVYLVTVPPPPSVPVDISLVSLVRFSWRLVANNSLSVKRSVYNTSCYKKTLVHHAVSSQKLPLMSSRCTHKAFSWFKIECSFSLCLRYFITPTKYSFREGASCRWRKIPFLIIYLK